MSEKTENANCKAASSLRQYLPFEDEIAAIDEKIEDLKKQGPINSLQGPNARQIRELQVRQTEWLKKIYSNL